MAIVPVFIFSLPRSGSTFTQRVLAAHDGVASTAEPWLLLPMLTPLVPGAAVNGPWDRTVSGALSDFMAGLPQGADSYRAEVRAMAQHLYTAVGGPDARYFIDKTPPYHLISEEVLRTFPDARFLLLWRNPLSVLASIVDTLGNGRWVTYHNRGTLFHGIENLVSTYERHTDRVHKVRYEDLLHGTGAWQALCDHIGLQFQPEALSSFSEIRYAGRMGDPTGVHRYQAISDEPVERWRSTLHNPIRREWARRWLRWIGRERLAVMGYDLDDLTAQLATVTGNDGDLGADVRELGLAALREAAKSRLPNDNFRSSWRALLGV
jgi:hypothetical protein